MTQLEILEAQLKQLEADLPNLKRKANSSRFTQDWWMNQRRLKLHLSDIDLTKQRITNLKRHKS